MNLEHTISFIEVAADDFGDDVTGIEYETAAAVETAASFAHGNYADVQTGALSVWIEPTSDVWQDKRLRMAGMLGIYDEVQYRVTGVRPGGSLLTNEEDLIELTLTKAEADDE